MLLVDLFVEIRLVQESVEPVENEVLDQCAEVHLPENLEPGRQIVHSNSRSNEQKQTIEQRDCEYAQIYQLLLIFL